MSRLKNYLNKHESLKRNQIFSCFFFINIFKFKGLKLFLIPNKIKNKIVNKTTMKILVNKNIKAN